MKPFAFCILLFAFSPAIAQDYNVSLIPDSLKQHANVVKRLEETSVIIKSYDRAVIKRKYAYTILNEAGNRYSGYINHYDKLVSLEDVTGNLFDANGKKLKSVKKKDISDVSLDDDMSLATDDRMKRHNFYYRQYPYTIEYEDEQIYKGIFYLPKWQPVEDERFAVQQSRFIVEAPIGYKLRYKQFNFPGTPVLTQGKSDVYMWELKNIKPIKAEYYQPSWTEVTPTVYIAPSEFEIGGYKGNMESWSALGKFITTLNAGRDELPEHVRQDVQRLTKGITNIEDKVAVLYDYMQKNTRYISIQMGIGGWQPFDAKYVATKKYGDCKALSNYMVSLLKAAGVPANYVLINSGAGRKGLWEDFPSPYFNHAIMCVPMGKDTIWLECTSQTTSAGYMGSSNGNRQALLIGDEGGYVVATPRYKAEDNLQLRKIEAHIDEAGNLVAEVKTHFTGIQQEMQHSLIHYATKEQRDKHLNNEINLATYKVEQNEYKESKGRLPKIDEYLKITSPNYASITGKRLFIQPNLFNRTQVKLPTDEPRKYDIEFTSSYRDVDTISIFIPAGYTVEAMPKDVELRNDFAHYKIQFNVENSQVKCLRISERFASRLPPSRYGDVVKYYQEMYKADRSKIVLIKKD